MKRAKALILRKMIEKSATYLSDNDALEAVELYPMWAVNTAYTADERIRHEDILYRCVQAHTSQEGWEPPNVDEWPEWIQPAGSQDAYSKGDKVSHNDKHWVSDVDNNVWEPGVYGWQEVS